MEYKKSQIFPKLKKAASQLNFVSPSPLQLSNYFDSNQTKDINRFENPDVTIFNNPAESVYEAKKMSRDVSGQNYSLYDRNSIHYGTSKQILTNNKFSFCKTKNKSRKLIPTKKHLLTNYYYSSDYHPIFLKNVTSKEIDLRSTVIEKVDSFKNRIQNQSDSLNPDNIVVKSSKKLDGNDKLVLDKINKLLYPQVKSNTKPYHKNWITRYMEECRHQSLNHMMIQNPLNQINKNITFPLIVNNRELIHSLWTDNLKNFENKKNNFPIDKLNIKSK